MTLLNPLGPPGWSGKLPMLGDFAHRRLPEAIVRSCDEWLSAGIAQSRTDLGPAWLETYLSAPVWCFALAPRVLDGTWWIGVLMPSVDAVGRYFPLLVMKSTIALPTDASTLAKLADWYGGVAEAALSTLQSLSTLEAFETQLASIPWPLREIGSPAPMPSDASNFRIIVRDSQTWLNEAPAHALTSALALLASHSLWWPLASPGQSTEVSVISGLPAAKRFAHLLQGRL